MNKYPEIHNKKSPKFSGAENTSLVASHHYTTSSLRIWTT